MTIFSNTIIVTRINDPYLTDDKGLIEQTIKAYSVVVSTLLAKDTGML